MPEDTVAVRPRSSSLVTRVAERYGVEPARMLDTLKATAFKVRDGPQATNEQMMALLIVSEQHKLNPFTREIFAFPDKGGGIVPVVSLDGWARIINEHPAFDGVEFEVAADGSASTCILWRKDRAHATRVTEYLAECKRNTAPWQSHPRRMLRHKSLIQCARLAFGFAGIYDEDEAQRIVAVEPQAAPSSAARVRAVLRPQAELVIDAEPPAPPPAEEPAAIDPGAYESLLRRLVAADTKEDAEGILDEARDRLTPADRAALEAAFEGRWQQPLEN